jgi:hypothetical protein
MQTEGHFQFDLLIANFNETFLYDLKSHYRANNKYYKQISRR